MKALRLSIEHDIVVRSIEELRQGGRARTERFVLWLGRRNDDVVRVVELYVPNYTATSDYFRIDRLDMASLLAYLREHELSIGAQLHTHPTEAFHSAADDRWAIVRHAGALSIVLPFFGRMTKPENFLSECTVFALSRDNRWQEVPRERLDCILTVVT